ncbi:MAG: hypothetical protein E7501_01020 [Ruminococcus sp.]|nr:hypothetical protein [Ruminococcus sp.]MBQ8906118.1 hypothetical protein [Ruminococcus sp.]
MAYYPFSQRPGMLAFTCTHVMDGEADIRLVTHHFDDGSWEFLCNTPTHTDAEAVIITIGELLKLDDTIEALSDLPVGCCATRSKRGEKWNYARLDGEPWYPASASRMPK